MDPLRSIAPSQHASSGRLRRDHTIRVGTPGLLRAINERTVLELMHRQGPLSRAQVARVSGLSKPTVSLSLASLLDEGLVREALNFFLAYYREHKLDHTHVYPGIPQALGTIRQSNNGQPRTMAVLSNKPFFQK